MSRDPAPATDARRRDPRSSREFRAVLAPVSQPRWHYLYLALAAFNVLTVAASVVIGRRLSAVHRAALEDEQAFVARRAMLARVFGPLETLYTAGRRVSGPDGVPAARRDLERGEEAFRALVRSIRDEVAGDRDSASVLPLLAALRRVEAHVADGSDRLGSLLDAIRSEGRAPSAPETNALDTAMDSAFGDAAGLLTIVDSVHDTELAARDERAHGLARTENLVLGLFATMLITATWYGVHLWRHAARVASDRARLEEALLDAHQRLEERVVERTADLAEAHEALRQAQRLEAVGRLAGGIAHEFNNLMTVVIGHCAELEAVVGASQAGDVRAIQDAAEQTARITSQLLAFGRKQVLRPTLTDVNEIVRRCLQRLQPLARPDQSIETRLAAEPLLVMADADQLQQIVMHLATNAYEAMPSHGLLTIETADADLDRMYAEYRSVVVPGRYVMIAVSDTGIGIEPDAKPHLFEPFYTTKGSGSGAGLGLATVYGIVKQSGGYIWVYSELGVGSAFRVYLPRADGSERSEDDAAPRGVHTILLVEDDESVRAVAARALTWAGHRVLEAADGRAARAVAGTRAPIDLMIVDVMLPDGPVRDTLAHLRSVRPDAGVLCTSGFAESEARPRIGPDPDVPFLRKPYTIRELVEHARAILDQPRSPSTTPR